MNINWEEEFFVNLIYHYQGRLVYCSRLLSHLCNIKIPIEQKDTPVA